MPLLIVLVSLLISSVLYPASISAADNISSPTLHSQPVIRWGNTSYHDSLGARDPWVIRDQGTYYLYYDCTEDLLNSSFENKLGTNGWETYEATITASSEQFFSGQQSLKLVTNPVTFAVPTAGVFTGNYYFDGIADTTHLATPTGLEVTANTEYIASVYVQAPHSAKVGLVVVEYKDDPGLWTNHIDPVVIRQDVSGSDSWQRLWVKFTTQSITKAVTLSFVADGNTISYWDAVQLERVTDGRSTPTDFPVSMNFNRNLEDTIGWRACVATSADGVNFQKRGPVEVTGTKGAWENFEKPGWVGSSFIYLNMFSFNGYWYANTWESGYQLLPGNPYGYDPATSTRREYYGNRRAFYPVGPARSGLVRATTPLGPFERLSATGPITNPLVIPISDVNSCAQQTRNTSSVWGCEYIAASGVPIQINDEWVLFLSGETTYRKDDFDWNGGKSPLCGANGISSGLATSSNPLGPWISSYTSRLFSPAETCSFSSQYGYPMVPEGPIYYFDISSNKHLVFVNNIAAGSIEAFWTTNPLSLPWPMANHKTIITGSQIPWRSAGPGFVNLPTVVETLDQLQLLLYFGAGRNYTIREGWKDFLFHDIGLLTFNLPLFTATANIDDLRQAISNLNIFTYNQVVANFGKQ